MKKGNKVLLIFASLSFVIAFIEGYLFYENYQEFALVHFLLSIQNGIKAFLFSPDISVTDILEQIRDSQEFVHYCIGYAYVITTFIAPLCTAGALFMMVQLMFRRGMHFRHSKNARRILLFGYNDYVKTLLKNLPEKQTDVIHLITNEEFTSDEELEILKSNVILHNVNCRSLSQKDLATWKKKIELSKTEHIILFEDSAYDNFTLYLFLINLLKEEENLPETIKFFCSCDEDGVRVIWEDLYDSELKNPEDCKCNIDIEIFSIPELCARELFADPAHPIYQYNLALPADTPSRWDVHMLIIGLGKLGSSILSHAINQSILHSQSRIIIDIVDYDIDVQFSNFANKFSFEQSGITGDCIEIHSPTADGQLLIRPHKLDAREKNLELLLADISKDLPITYVAICLKDNSVAIPCMLKLQELFQKENRGNVPIAIRLEMEKVLATYLKNNKKHFRNVFPIPYIEDNVSIEKICNNVLDRKSKEFHDIYSKIDFVSRSDYKPRPAAANAQSTWDSQEAFKKESTRYLCFHEHIKEMLYAQGDFRSDMPQDNNGNLYWGIFEKRDNAFLIADDPKEVVRQINANPFLREMAMLEHRRWSYFMLMQGWKHVNGPKNVERKETPYLVNWEILCKENPATCVYDLMSLFKVILEQDATK